MTERLLAELYQVGVNTINHHIKEFLADGELTAEGTIRNYRIVQIEGARTVERQVEHYSLEMILAVGYRVRSPRGTAFSANGPQAASKSISSRVSSWMTNA